MQWEFVHGLFNQAVYGGRIDNPVDTDVLVAYLEEYFNNSFFSGSGKGPKVKFGAGFALPSSCEYRVCVSLIHMQTVSVSARKIVNKLLTQMSRIIET